MFQAETQAEASRRTVLRRGLVRLDRAAVLESAPGYGPLGRYSLYAGYPRGIFQIVGDRWQLSADWPGARPAPATGPLEALTLLLRSTAAEADVSIVHQEILDNAPHTADALTFSSVNDSDAMVPIFAGGWIGFIGYDIAPLLEVLPRQQRRKGSLPDLDLAYYDTFAIHDRATGVLRLFAVDRFGEGSAARGERLEHFVELLDSGPLEEYRGPLIADVPDSDFTPDEFCCTVERILEYIRAGDIFQANFAQRFAARFVGSISELCERCFRQSPAPFGGVIRGDGWTVVSTSPERFFLLEPDGRVETRPIKGTRARGKDQIHDLLLRADLASSAKDRAELTMIVDLERNDLGRVCDYGSVKVTRHAAIESFSNVHHLVSTVEGRLRRGLGPAELVRAMFPGGSITGAPKIRAMQIIDELERCRRGVYTGAIGYISDHGRADFNIAIRTLVVDADAVHYHVGGGIVADSNPVAEYSETLAKGRRLREILLGVA
jgi:para-aminobenzoate synthetase component 1